MIGKSEIKRVVGLHQKKVRKETGLFIAEGPKVIHEFLASGFRLVNLYVTDREQGRFLSCNQTVVSPSDLSRMSVLTTPAGCLAVFAMREAQPLPNCGLIVVLDEVKDPGNLGTIIRLCDWFGINHIVLSEASVDVYNPKVIQATMGSLARVAISYTTIRTFLQQATLPILGTYMEGENLYTVNLPGEAIVVFGNEANGISADIESFIQKRLSIPRFGTIQAAESLNVATAAAITLSEFCRRA
jgi:TrmH family RNA methyltransferase